MFKRLKYQLILINVASLSLVLAFVFSGIYMFTKMSIDLQTHAYMVSIAKSEELLTPITAVDKAWSQSNSFFFRLDSDGRFIDYTANLTIPEAERLALLTYVQKQPAEEGFFKNENYNLKFLKYEKTNHSVIVFLDNRIEAFILNAIITRSIAIGIISLAFVFIISWLLANKAIKPIKQSWEKQMAFVSDASHELRTPMAVMTSTLEVILDNEEETVKEQSHWLNNIKEELDRLHRLVNDLLQLARYDANEEFYITESFDLIGLTQNLVTAFQPLAAKEGIDITFTDLCSRPLYILGNAYRMKQLLTILLDNAIQFNCTNGSVVVTATLQNNLVSLSVCDTGDGISQEHLDKIFDRFYRVDKSRSRNNGGSGLGLSIAKCIVLEHKGKISVTSTLGQGTCFHMTFPVES